LILLIILLLGVGQQVFVSAQSCKDYDGDVSDCQDTNDPNPIITVNYGEKPVTINNFALYGLFSSVYSIPIHQIDQSGNKIYNFTSSTVILDGLYKFEISATDEDENLKVSELILAVDVDDMDIWVSEPRVPFINPADEQTIAIGQKLPFNLEISTLYPSTCRLTKYDKYMDSEVDLARQFSTAFYILEGLGTTHALNVVAASSQEPNRVNLPLDHEFDYEDPYYDQYVVICEQDSADNQKTYSSEKIYVGYDETPFDFQVSANPETIEDNANAQTQAEITSSGEQLHCTYDFILNQNSPFNYRNSDLNDYGEINSIQHYTDFKQDLNQTFSFQESIGDFELAKTYSYSVNITCQNPALYTSSKVVDFDIRISPYFDINFEDDNRYFLTNSPDLTVTTSNQAVCSYRLDEDDLTRITETPTTYHYFKPTSLEEGIHSLYLSCSSGATTIHNLFHFSIDTTNPSEPNASLNKFYCGGRFDIEINPTAGDGIVAYNYSVYNSTSLIPENLIADPELTDYSEDETQTPSVRIVNLVEDATYVWKINAIDRSGNTGKSLSFATVAKNPLDVVCDNLNPLVETHLKIIPTGYAVSINCTDHESGCTDKFNYSFIGLDESCAENPPLSKQSYSSGPLLLTDDGKLCYAVEDMAGNSASGSRLVTPNMQIDLVSPRFGIANEKSFSLNVRTSREVTCKHGYRGEEHPTNLNNWYNSLKYLFIDFDDSGTTHLAQISASEISQLNENLDEESQPWIVICKDGDFLQSKEFNLGYDTSEPSITISANPNPVVDPGDITTTLTVESDDPVVCTYLDSDENPIGFTGYDPSNKTAYEQHHSQELSFWGISNEDIIQRIACKNIAQNSVEEEYTISVDLRDEVGIHVHSDRYFNKNPVMLNLTTDHSANCIYRLDEEDEFKEMKSSTQREHTATFNLQDGKYDIEIQCTSRSSGLKGTVFTQVIVDTKAPILDIVSKEETCSLSQVKFTIISNGTGSSMDSFVYTLSNSSSQILNHSTRRASVTVTEDLIEGQKYTITVEGTDKAGNVGKTSLTVMASTFNSEVCDVTPPTAKVHSSLKWGGADTFISCEDSQSGCIDSFNYLWVNKFCNASYSSEKYENLPLFSEKTSLFCYQVFDKANNDRNGSKKVIVPNYCFNGIEDPFEEGVDCGGKCPVSCGTCDNNQRDAFELGVDCGGVCESIKSCKIKTNNTVILEQNDSDTCRVDSDCKGMNDFCISGECVERKSTPPKKDLPEEEDTFNIWGLILLILGLFMMGGGAYYIYYAETQRATYLRRQQMYQQQNQQRQTMAQTAEQQARLKKLREEQIKALREKQAKGLDQRNQKVQDRKAERSSLLDSFGKPIETKEIKEKKQIQSANDKDDLKSKQSPTSTIKKPELKIDEHKVDEDGYVELSASTEKKKSDSIFDKLEEMTNKSPIKKDNEASGVEKQKKDFKESSNDIKNKSVSDGTKISSKITKPSIKDAPKNSFDALQLLINSTKNNKLPPGDFKHLGKINSNVSSEDFVSALTKEVSTNHFDQVTLVSLLRVLLKEGKLNKVTLTEILSKLESGKFIPQNSANKLFLEISR